MKKRFAYLLTIGLLPAAFLIAQKGKSYEVKSQDGNISLQVEAGK